MVAREASIPFAAEASETPTRAYQWTLLKDARYGWQGGVIAKLALPNEVLQLFRSVEGKAITVPHGGRIVLEALPHSSLMAEARNHAAFPAAPAPAVGT